MVQVINVRAACQRTLLISPRSSSSHLRCCKHLRAASCRARGSEARLQTASVASGLAWLVAAPALALVIREEPSNALSLPTWAIHISSVAEWIVGMLLMWTFAEVSERPYWKAMSWAMLPSLVSAMCACTWHFFYNAPELEWLVAVQAGFTVLGNIALWWGAYHVYKQSQAQASEPS